MFTKTINIFLLIFLFQVNAIFSQENDSLQVENLLTEEEINFELLNAAYEGNEKNVLMLLKAGANVNTSTYEGITPLMYASQGGYMSIINILIFNGAKLNAAPNDGTTALISAVQNNHEEILEYLILNDALINSIDILNRSALWYAVAYNNFILSDMLIFYGADLDQKDSFGNTPMIISVSNSDFDIIELLINKGANVNIADNEGFSPLMFASQIGNLSLVEFLINNDADVLQKNIFGMDALSLAIKNNHAEIVKFLIENAADVNLEINPHLNPLSLAKFNKNKEIIEILKSKGAVEMNKFFVNKFVINLNSSANTKDFITGLEIGFAEEKTHTILLLGYQFRPWSRNVLVEKSDNYFYQFWENRSMITLNFAKSFSLHSYSEKSNLGLDAILKVAYTFGNYRGSTSKPKNKLMAVPAINFFYKKDFYKIFLGYEYLNLNTEPISPHRLNFGVGFYLNSTKYREKNKEMIE